MSNYIAAWGPNGPLYLEKTHKANIWSYRNGFGLLVRDLLPINSLQEYVIIEDNFAELPWDIAVAKIKAMFNENQTYLVLCDGNLTPYEPNTKTISGGVNIPPLSNLDKQARAYLKYYKIECTKTELKVAKELIGLNPDHHWEQYITPTESESQINTKQTKSEQSMLQTNIITTNTINTVNDIDVNDLSNDELLDSVIQLEKSIDQLQSVKSKSKFVDKTISDQQKTLSIVLKHLDARK